MTVAAVVVTMNRDEHITSCVRALRREGVDRIIVVDNGDGPDIADVEHVRSGDNLGPAGGFALGMDMARNSDYLWLFNDDDQPLPGALKTLLQGFQSQDVGAVGSWVESGHGIRPRGARWREREVKRGRADSLTGEYGADVTTFSGLLLRGNVVERVGLPRADLFMMFEEHEYCMRIRDEGYRIRILRAPQVRALGLGSQQVSLWRLYYRTRNHLRVCLDRKEYGAVWFWLVRSVRVILWGHPKHIVGKLRVAVRGALDAIRGRMGRQVEPW